jgi:hypothetical protein
MVQTVPEDVRSYLDAVRKQLADLPQQEREDLLADVESSLVESANEGESPIAARLGPPEGFAEELRAAAGLVTEDGPTGTPPDSPLDRLARAYRSLDADPHFARARGVARDLAPIWWLTRAYILVAAIALLTNARWSTTHPALPTWSFGKAGLLVLAVAGGLSCWLGFRGRRASTQTRGALVVVNIGLLAASIPALGHLTDTSPGAAELLRKMQAYQVGLAASPVPVPVPAGLSVDGRPIANVYPYSRDGRLLLDVLLYDENGNPIELRPNSVDPNRRMLVTTAGVQVFNSFPVRYFEPGTRIVADPAAGPKPIRRTFVTPAIRGEHARTAARDVTKR